jgi:integrase
MTQIIPKDTNFIDLQKQDLTIYAEDVKYWESDYINTHIDAIKNKAHKTFFMLLWRTGMRVSEAIGIEKQHVDLDNYIITIRWLKKRNHEKKNKNRAWINRDAYVLDRYDVFPCTE